MTLYTDGKKVGEGNVDATLTNVFSADDGCDVGEDTGAPVSPDYGPHGNAFNGRVKGVQLAIAEAAESADHLVDPEAAIRVAMARPSVHPGRPPPMGVAGMPARLRARVGGVSLYIESS